MIQYSDLTTALGDLLITQIINPASATPSNDTNFNNILPRIIDDAEQRIYRELDFLETRTSLVTAGAVQNQRSIPMPSAIIVLQGMSVISDCNIVGQNDIAATSFLSSSGSLLVQINDSNTPNIAVGDWVNIIVPITVVGIAGALQGYYQVGAIGSGNYSIIITSPATASGNGATNSFTTTAGSNRVQLVTSFHYKTGSNYNVGSPTTVGGITLLGDYTITSSTSAGIFFQAQAIATASATVSENNGATVIQYLGTIPEGTRNPIERVSKDFLDISWPSDFGSQGTPEYFAQLNTSTLLVAPSPDVNYLTEFTGVIRPAPMSSTNTTTYLGTTYPDLFLAACMVFGSLYQKDADLPPNSPPGADGTKWEATYQLRKASVMSEIQRQKGQGPNWSSMSGTPESTPARP